MKVKTRGNAQYPQGLDPDQFRDELENILTWDDAMVAYGAAWRYALNTHKDTNKLSYAAGDLYAALCEWQQEKCQ